MTWKLKYRQAMRSVLDYCLDLSGRHLIVRLSVPLRKLYHLMSVDVKGES